MTGKLEGHTSICRKVKRFGQPWLVEVARGVEGEFVSSMEGHGARLEVLPIRISHLYHVGEGVEIALVPHDPKTWTWWGEYESDLEIRRRRRLGRTWEELRTQDEVRSWLRNTAESYEAQLRLGTEADRRSRAKAVEAPIARGDPLAPIFLVEGDDVIVVDSVFDAQNFVEPQDVDVGFAFDALGRRLHVTTDGKLTFIRLAELTPSKPAELEAVLRRYLKWRGDAAAGEPGCDLPCLVVAARTYLVVPPGRGFQDWLARVRRRRRAGEG